jgi:hypothetical protein
VCKSCSRSHSGMFFRAALFLRKMEIFSFASLLVCGGESFVGFNGVSATSMLKWALGAFRAVFIHFFHPGGLGGVFGSRFVGRGGVLGALGGPYVHFDQAFPTVFAW